jgi:hypothetical protein
MIIKIDAKELYAPQTEVWERSLKTYAENTGLDSIRHGSFYLTASSGDMPTPENTGTLLVRIALADVEGKLSKESKYVVLQTYYDDGDLGTIDVVRLPLGYHREIVLEYLRNILVEAISRQPESLLSKEGFSRYLTAGGFVEGNEKTIRFQDSSGDFSNRFSTYSVNDIASYLVGESGLFETTESDGINNGSDYIERCLDIMLKHKLTPEFYSQLIDLYLLKNVREEQHVGSHLLYSLNMMKSIDRAVKEGKDVIEALTLETVEGIGREMLLRGVTERFKKELKQQKE